MSHPQSPADVLRYALVLGGQGKLPSATTAPAWPIYTGHMPGKPDNAVCVYDTAGIRDGRLMPTGESLTKNGWEIRVRATNHPDAYAKIRAIQKHLDTIRMREVVLGDDAFTIASVTQTSDALAIGQEPDAERRVSFTLNGTMTHTEKST